MPVSMNIIILVNFVIYKTWEIFDNLLDCCQRNISLDAIMACWK